MAPKKPQKRVRELAESLAAAERANQAKELELRAFQQAVNDARDQVAELENDASNTAHLEQTVEQLLTRQRETTREYSDYENRVLVLELQSLVDRYRMMDIENIEENNHTLREEVFRLQAENMQLSRAVSENSMRTRRDVARIEIAMEGTVRERLLSARKTMMDQLVSQLDVKTRLLLTNHGELQEAMISLADQVTVLDDKYRTLSMQKRQFKVDSELGESMFKLQARQLVVLRHQLDHSFLVNSDLKARLEQEESKVEKAEAEALRANSLAFKLTRDIERMRGITGDKGVQGDDSDSAFGLAGEEFETEVAALNRQLGHVKARQERACQQRDHWRDRCLLYERACSQLQASLHALQGQVQLSMPSGVAQPVDSVWCTKKGPAISTTGLDQEGSPDDLGQSGASLSGDGVALKEGALHSLDGGHSSIGHEQQAAPIGGNPAAGGWLSGNAVRVQSARMRRASGSAAMAAQPTSAAPGVSAALGASGGDAAGLRAWSSSRQRPGSAAVRLQGSSSARPSSASPVATTKPSAGAPRPASAMPGPSLHGASTVPAGRPLSAAPTVVKSSSRRPSELLAHGAGDTHARRPGSAVGSRPSSAAAGAVPVRKGRGYRIAQMNAAQVGWLSGLQPGWMGSRGVQQLGSQLASAGVPLPTTLPLSYQAGGPVVHPEQLQTTAAADVSAVHGVASSGFPRAKSAHPKRPSTAPAPQHHPSHPHHPHPPPPPHHHHHHQQQQRLFQSSIYSRGGHAEEAALGLDAPIQEEEEGEEEEVVSDDGGDSDDQEVPWDAGKSAARSQQQGLEQVQQPILLLPPQQQQQQPAARGQSATLTAPSRLYSTEPEPFQVHYPNPAAADRGVKIFRPKSAAPVTRSSPMILPRQRKRAGSLRYFADPSTQNSVPSPQVVETWLNDAEQLCLQQHEDEADAQYQSTPAGLEPASTPPSLPAHCKLYAKRTAPRQHDDASALFSSRSKHKPTS